ncbi:MAG: AmmeMemoRadiSam system radical SAM enzyme [Bacteroidales bacterium]|nr:AmmeMemoRadiSam system radical SAM enzyme [Bacteroidales bacterium]
MNTEAQWYLPLNDKTVQCTLCPHNCTLKEGKAGICRVRINQRGKLITEVNGFVSSINFDPIEKKPLFHFYPGSTILSIGTYGCNLRCFFCQNCSISQTDARPELPHSFYTPEQIIQIALKRPENIGIAFTYNEPVVWFEYMYDIARLAKKAGLKTVMVTNGYINKEPLNALLEYMDAFSVDLKAFNEEFYTKVTSSKLEPVKETLKQISLAGKHLEVVNLVIPELNDDEENFASMVKWIAVELGRDTVFHISRYYPNYKLTTDPTPVSLIRRLKSLAEKELNSVYSGNINAESNDTHCMNCNNILISRHSYVVSLIGIDTEGKCNKCGNYFLKKT